MNDLIEQRLRAAALAVPTTAPALSDLRRRAARRRLAATGAAISVVAAVALTATVLPDLRSTNEGFARSTSVTQFGVRLAIEIEDPTLALGDVLRVSVAVTNTTDESVGWLPAGCENQLAGGVVFVARAADPGRTWQGHAAEFKRSLLGRSTGQLGFLRPAADLDAPTPGDCPTTPPQLGAGKTQQIELAWRAELKEGGQAGERSGVTVDFRLADAAGQPRRLEANLPVRITGDSSRIGLVEAVDAALADREFAAWLEEQPTPTVTDAFAGIERDQATWRVGLSVRPQATGFVTIDARNGEVLTREVPAPPTG